MALGDYTLCSLCECRAFYDANINWEAMYVPVDEIHGQPDPKAMRVLCADCAETHRVEILSGDQVVMPRSLTAENGAKGALRGEFFVEHEEVCGECGGSGIDDDSDDTDTCQECNATGTVAVKVTIPWTMIKEIYAAAVKLFDQKGTQVAETAE